MNIGYDTHSLFAECYKDYAVGEYCKNLINEIENQNKESVYKFNSYGDSMDGVSHDNLKTYLTRKKQAEAYLPENDLFVKIIAAQMQHFCASNDIDIMHFTSPFNYEAANLLKVPQTTAKVVTVYDFLPMIFPEYYLNDPVFKLHYLRQRDLLVGFDAFITVSKSTAEDLMDFANIPGDKIFIVDLEKNRTPADISHPMEEKVLYNFGAEKSDALTRPVIAKKTLEAYKEIIHQKAESQKTKISLSGKKRLAWFSPLPPVSSGIANYSYELLMLLEKRMDIDIYIDSGYTPDVPGLKESKIFLHTGFEEMYDKVNYDAIVYQMGSSSFHTYLMEYIKKYNGIVVSHDTNYHPMLYFQVDGDIECMQYREVLYMEYGTKKGNAALEDILRKKDYHPLFQQQYPLCNYFLGDTKKLIVTTGYNKLKALEYEIGRDVTVIYLHSWVPGNFHDLDKNELRNKLGIKDNAFIFGSFGSANQYKRNMESLKAFDIIAPEHDNAYFYIVGGYNKHYHDELLSFIKQNDRLKDRIIFTGAVNDDEFYEYMKITDVFIGLRSDSNSNSGPLLRALGAGLPCIISGVDIFDYLDDKCVIKVGIDDDEIKNLASAMKKLLQNEQERNELGQKALQLSKTMFSAESAADKYESVIGSFDAAGQKILLTNNDIDSMIEYYNKQYGSVTGWPSDSWLKSISNEAAAINNALND